MTDNERADQLVVLHEKQTRLNHSVSEALNEYRDLIQSYGELQQDLDEQLMVLYSYENENLRGCA